MKKNKKEKLTVNYLELTPVRIYEHELDTKGLVKVIVPKFTNKFMVKFIVPKLKTPMMGIKLDEFGSETWLQIDGEKKVEEIAKNLFIKFGEKINPVEERLTVFLSQLKDYKFISFKEL
jgi:hypothetical protein